MFFIRYRYTSKLAHQKLGYKTIIVIPEKNWFYFSKFYVKFSVSLTDIETETNQY